MATTVQSETVADDLVSEFMWLFQVIKQRTNPDELLDGDSNYSITESTLPELEGSAYAQLISDHSLNAAERLILILSLYPHIQPGLFHSITDKSTLNKLALIKSEQTSLSCASKETALFLIAGEVLEKRLECLNYFDEGHLFQKKQFFISSASNGKSTLLNQSLLATEEFANGILREKTILPKYSNDFPAQLITTAMDWDDLILAPNTRTQVEEVKIWFRQRDRLMNELGMSKRMNPGNKILFYGSPGTGKTLTAKLLGKYIQKEVFRIDLSMVVSKYIGETEKNLAKVFDKAESFDWILFFDEADALFGSRTKVGNSNDRHANQEVSYLLQRMEDFNGIVILASNMKNNIDDAFIRRFNNIVHFPFPKANERRLLWERTFPNKIVISQEVDLKLIADKYEFSGANITNIVAWCCLMAIEKGDYLITESLLRDGMSREMSKEGRTL